MRDIHDRLGGYPCEVISPGEVASKMRRLALLGVRSSPGVGASDFSDRDATSMFIDGNAQFQYAPFRRHLRERATPNTRDPVTLRPDPMR